MNYSVTMLEGPWPTRARIQKLELIGEHEGRRFCCRTDIGGMDAEEARDWLDWAATLGWIGAGGLKDYPPEFVNRPLLDVMADLKQGGAWAS